MSNIFVSSIGKKLIMSITGLFLIFFLLVHLTVNSLLLVGEEEFNIAAGFMETNPFIKILEPILALGFIFHIFYASYLTLKNQSLRPVKYQMVNQKDSSTWASRNMYILGGAVLTFLVIHIINFYWNLKFGEVPKSSLENVEVENTYLLVTDLFSKWWYDLIYIAGAILLGLHLTHGFWSSFQTLGWSNDLWRKRLEVIGTIYAYIIAIGFSIIPLYFLIAQNPN